MKAPVLQRKCGPQWSREGRNPYCYQGFLNEELATGAQVPKAPCNTSP